MINYWTILREHKIISSFFSSPYGIIILHPLLKLLLIHLKKRFFSLKSQNRRVTAFQLESVLLILRPWTRKAKSLLVHSNTSSGLWEPVIPQASCRDTKMPAGWSTHTVSRCWRTAAFSACGRHGGGCGAPRNGLPGSAGGSDAHCGGQKFQWEAFSLEIRKKFFPIRTVQHSRRLHSLCSYGISRPNWIKACVTSSVLTDDPALSRSLDKKTPEIVSHLNFDS